MCAFYSRKEGGLFKQVVSLVRPWESAVLLHLSTSACPQPPFPGKPDVHRVTWASLKSGRVLGLASQEPDSALRDSSREKHAQEDSDANAIRKN